MKQENQLFENIRDQLVESSEKISAGRMMSSPAITYNRKVFAFLSTKGKMVFRLGKEYDYTAQNIDIQPFNPFAKKGPLPGWFEVSYTSSAHWQSLAEHALAFIQS